MDGTVDKVGTATEMAKESSAFVNTKNLADNPTMLNTIAMQSLIFNNNLAQNNMIQAQKDAVSHHKRLDIIAETNMATASRSVAVTPLEEASAGAKAKEADLPGQIVALTSAMSKFSQELAAIQQSAKIAQTTHPESGQIKP